MRGFYEALHRFRQDDCHTCHKQWPTDRALPEGTLERDGVLEAQCNRCSNDLVEVSRTPSLPQVAKFGEDNGMVSPPVSEELQGLTMTEEMLTARASPVVKVVRLAGGMHGGLDHDDNGDVNVMQLFHTVADHDAGGNGEGDGDGDGDEDGERDGDGNGDGDKGRAPRSNFRGVERVPNPLEFEDLADDPEGASGIGALPRRGPTESFVPFESLMRVAQRYVANVPGTDGYWMRWQRKLEESLNQLQSLTTFTTYSAANRH
eukprot:g12267.t1